MATEYNKKDLYVLFTLFFLSGFSGLIYESAWSQQLSLIFGSTELAIAAVLASYMAGLALGASLISIWIDRIKQPIKTYAIIEVAIAISALCIPYFLQAVSALYSYAYTTPELSSITTANVSIYIMGSFAVLLIPTTLMGATLPLLSKYVVKKDDSLGNKIGHLYSINTFGACTGVLISAFVLLPTFGLGLTIYSAVLINFIIFIVGIYYFKNKSADQKLVNNATPNQAIFKNKWIFPVMFISGATSLAYEILWTRLLSHLLGSSIYSFGVMLFVFLLAIAVGAYFGSLLCKKFNPIKSFTWVQLAIALCFFISFFFANTLPDYGISSNYGSFFFVYESLLIGLITLFPGAMFIGATFPLAIEISAINNNYSGIVSARVYSWNTLGAICGSILMGFYLLSTHGFAISTQLLSSTSIVLALIVIFYSSRNIKTAFILLTFLTLVWTIPINNPTKLLKFSTLGKRQQPGEINYLGIGDSATVMLLDQGGEMRLLTNGLPESAVQISGGRENKYFLAYWLSMLPTLVNPAANDMLIIGLGAGLTLKAVPQSLKSIDVVELEQEVINANRSLSTWRGIDPLQDPRLKLHNNDARNALRNSTQMFDIIVSQPSHPWTAGAASLYTQEFFSTVKSRLNQDGVFIQWIGMRFIDTELLKSLLATLNAEFNHVELFQPLSTGGLIFVSSSQPIRLSNTQFNATENKLKWQILGTSSINQVALAKRLNADDSRKFSSDAQLSTDYFNVLKMRSPKIIKTSLNKPQFNNVLAQYDPLLESINTDTFTIVRRLIQEHAYNRLKYLINAIDDSLTKQVATAIVTDAQNQKINGQGTKRHLFDLLSILQSQSPQTHTKELDEILFYLINHNTRDLINTSSFPQLQSIINDTPLALKLLDAWRLLQLKKWQKVQQIESTLASINTSHPAYEMANKLRLGWRLFSNEEKHLRMAMILIDEQLALFKNSPRLIQKINLAIKSNQYDIAIASLYELLTLTPKSNNKKARNILLRLLDKTVQNAQLNGLYSDQLKDKVSTFQKAL